MKEQVIKKSKPVREKLKRFNQIVLTFPVWIVLGVSKAFKKDEKDHGWQKSSMNKKYDKMY